ncbi:hypothetical protein JKP88DRAFT_346590 [Tribonema minus]|uniref:Uncharacterized protein n=1 Tax=Tribonema minus TaxID=303371 RepID=A0A835Z066_9STRA|nr:hypothetical protein JKP88DRAFT_346590 [Tribonema minus]
MADDLAYGLRAFQEFMFEALKAYAPTTSTSTPAAAPFAEATASPQRSAAAAIRRSQGSDKKVRAKQRLAHLNSSKTSAGGDSPSQQHLEDTSDKINDRADAGGTSDAAELELVLPEHSFVLNACDDPMRRLPCTADVTNAEVQCASGQLTRAQARYRELMGELIWNGVAAYIALAICCALWRGYRERKEKERRQIELRRQEEEHRRQMEEQRQQQQQEEEQYWQEQLLRRQQQEHSKRSSDKSSYNRSAKDSVNKCCAGSKISSGKSSCNGSKRKNVTSSCYVGSRSSNDNSKRSCVGSKRSSGKSS